MLLPFYSSPKISRQLEVVCNDIDINHGNLNYCSKMRPSQGSCHPVCVTTNACFYGDHLFVCIYVCNSKPIAIILHVLVYHVIRYN
jgi:hypothetical protein